MTIALAELTFSQQTIVWSFNVAYNQSSGLENEQTAEAAAKTIANAWWAQLQPNMSRDTTFESCYVRMIETESPLPTYRLNREDNFGTLTSKAIPAISTIVVNLRNSAGLLKRPGRINLSGVGQEVLVSGVLNATFAAALQLNINENLLSLSGVDPQTWEGDLAVAVRAQGPGPPIPYVGIPVTDVSVTRELGSQLRRKGRKTGIRTTTSDFPYENP